MPISFSLRQIRYFVAIAELGSLSAAAKKLSISHSSVAVGIQDLEEEPACQLFERHARGMELTVKGHQFLRHAQKILSDVADARRSLEESRWRMMGILPDLAYRPWSLEGDKVEARPLIEAIPSALVGVVWPRGAATSPTVRSFLSILQPEGHPAKKQNDKF